MDVIGHDLKFDDLTFQFISNLVYDFLQPNIYPVLQVPCGDTSGKKQHGTCRSKQYDDCFYRFVASSYRIVQLFTI